jgi:hypothetical protein
MNRERAMHPTDKAARVAGAVYLSMAVTAPFSLIYILRTLIVRGDAEPKTIMRISNTGTDGHPPLALRPAPHSQPTVSSAAVIT